MRGGIGWGGRKRGGEEEKEGDVLCLSLSREFVARGSVSAIRYCFCLCLTHDLTSPRRNVIVAMQSIVPIPDERKQAQ